MARFLGRLFASGRPTLDVLGLAMVSVGIGMIAVPAGVIAGGVSLVLLRMAVDE